MSIYTANASNVADKRHFNVGSTRVIECDNTKHLQSSQHHTPSSSYEFKAHYDHIIEVMTERLRRAEEAFAGDGDFDFTPLDELRLKASGMAFQRVGSLDFYRDLRKSRSA